MVLPPAEVELPRFACRMVPLRALRFDGAHSADLGHLVTSVEGHHPTGGEPHPLHTRQLFPLPEEHRRAGQLPQHAGRRLASLFRHWQNEGHLRLDEYPSLYLHQLNFTDAAGIASERWGFYAVLALSPEGELRILPHERTLPTRVRRQIEIYAWRGAQILPLFMLYSDPEDRILTHLRGMVEGPPIIHFGDTIGHTNSLWAISNPEAQDHVRQLLGSSSLVIADGHHRFEAARQVYAQADRQRSGSSPALPVGEEDGTAYILSFLTPMEGSGLRLGAFHRAIPRLRGDLSQQMALLEGHFRIETLHPPRGETPGEWISYQLGRTPPSEHTFVLVGDRGLSTFLVSRPSDGDTRSVLEKLDLTVLHEEVITKLKYSGTLRYEQNVNTLWRQIQFGEVGLGCFLRPPSAHEVWDVAQAGVPMPPKATFFYPKILAGLIQFPHGFSRMEP